MAHSDQPIGDSNLGYCLIKPEPIITVDLPRMDTGGDLGMWSDHLEWLKGNRPDLVRRLFKQRNLAQYITLIVRAATVHVKRLRAGGMKRFLAIQQVYDEMIEPACNQASPNQQEPLSAGLGKEIDQWINGFGSETDAWDWTCGQRKN
jgi:hypothetical protein